LTIGIGGNVNTARPSPLDALIERLSTAGEASPWSTTRPSQSRRIEKYYEVCAECAVKLIELLDAVGLEQRDLQRAIRNDLFPRGVPRDERRQ